MWMDSVVSAGRRSHEASLVLGLGGHQWWPTRKPAALATQRGVYPSIFGLVLAAAEELANLEERARAAGPALSEPSHGCVTRPPWNIASFFLITLPANWLEFKALPPRRGDPGASNFQLVGEKPILPQNRLSPQMAETQIADADATLIDRLG